MPNRIPADRRQPSRRVRRVQSVPGEDQDLTDDEVWIAVQEF